MMLKDYPIDIDGVILPMPTSWKTDNNTVDVVNTTEAGTDIVVLTRKDKQNISLSFNVDTEWYKKFLTIRDSEPLSVSTYDPITNAYQIKQMRMRDFSATMVENSDTTPGTVGLWVVSFTLIEY